ncbi:MAG: helix-turn-helix domain-containing protein [Clostridia bacterium]|nr:helix-turn-helix domain-containing protein [Clostridia bacterium]
MLNNTDERYLIACGLNKTKGPYGSITPLFIGHSVCTKGHIYGPFRRKHFVFQYVLEGEKHFESPYGTFKVTKGDMIVMHRGDLVNYDCISETSENIWVEFDCTEPLPDAFDTTIIRNEKLRDIFLKLKNIEDITHGQNAYACSIIWQIIAAVDTGKPEVKRYSHYVSDALELIHRHYIQKITVSFLAKELNLNRSYFCDLFKKEVGISPKEYIDDYRISAACEILKQSELSISEVAENAGYSDLSSFSKAFKERVGVPPKAYREANKK